METTIVKLIRLIRIGYRSYCLYDDDLLRIVYMDHFTEFKNSEDLYLANTTIERIQPAKLTCIGKYSFKRKPATSIKQKILELLSDEFAFVTTISGKTYCVKETPAEIESQL